MDIQAFQHFLSTTVYELAIKILAAAVRAYTHTDNYWPVYSPSIKPLRAPARRLFGPSPAPCAGYIRHNPKWPKRWGDLAAPLSLDPNHR